MYDKIVIGIDQSYKNTGVSICADGQLQRISHIYLDNLPCNTAKRQRLFESLDRLLLNVTGNRKAKQIRIIFERIRLSSDGFTNINYIKSIGAMNAVIVDLAKAYGILCYSVDTRSWKSQVIGTSKPEANKFGIDPNKWPTIKYIKKLGYGDQLLKEASKAKKKGVIIINGKRYTLDDDAADSAGIALYGFIPQSQQKLEEEH